MCFVSKNVSIQKPAVLGISLIVTLQPPWTVLTQEGIYCILRKLP
jgi:hypothetical protein